MNGVDDGRVVVIGVGNPFRSDDGAGIEAVNRLAGRLPAGVEVVEADGEPAALVNAWEGAGVCFVVDAVRSDGPAGEIHRVEVDGADAGALPTGPHHGSSHALGLGDAVQLAAVLDRLPGRLVLIGIAGARFEIGNSLSEPVLAAVGTVVDTLVGEVAAACA